MRFASFSSRYTQRASSLAILFFCAAELVSVSPSSAITVGIGQSLKPFLSYFGLYNTCNVFAPEPVKYNQYFYAHIYYADGSTSIWQFPRLSQWAPGDWRRIVNLPYTEWQYYFMGSAPVQPLLEDAARFIARSQRNRGLRPVKIVIYRQYNTLLAPASKTARNSPLSGTQPVLNYSVQAGDLL